MKIPFYLSCLILCCGCAEHATNNPAVGESAKAPSAPNASAYCQSVGGKVKDSLCLLPSGDVVPLQRFYQENKM